MLVKPKLALSFDVEATGERPGEGKGSMVMLGVVAIKLSPLDDAEFIVSEENQTEWILEKKLWSLSELDGRSERCWSEFWMKHLDVWEFINKHKKHPSVVMMELNDWLNELSEQYDWYWVANPAAFDWAWLKYTWEKYMIEWYFNDQNNIRYANIGYKAECMNGYKHYQILTEEEMSTLSAYHSPNKLEVTHNALDDAMCQGYKYVKSIEWFKRHFRKNQ